MLSSTLTSHTHSSYHRIHAHVAHAHATSHRHHVVHPSSATAHAAHITTSHGIVHHRPSVETTIVVVVVVVHAHVALEAPTVVVAVIIIIVATSTHGTREVAVVLVVATAVGVITSSVEPTPSSTTIALIVRAIVILGVGSGIERGRATSNRPLFSGASRSVLGKRFERILHRVGEDNIVLTIGRVSASSVFNLVFCGCSRLG